MAERLQNAGISWKCYQQADNYGTNVLEFFSQFINAPTTSSLYQNAFGVSTLFDGAAGQRPDHGLRGGLRQRDAADGQLALPDQRRLGAPVVPAGGGCAIRGVQDRGAGRQRGPVELDRVHPRTTTRTTASSTTCRRSRRPRGTADEFVTLNSPGGTPGGGLNLGSGFRVPAIVISPWTVGGYVCPDAARPHVGAALHRARHGHHRAQHQRLAAQHLRRLHHRLPAVTRGGAVHPGRHGVGHRGAAGLPDSSSRRCPCLPSPARTRRSRCSSRVGARRPAEGGRAGRGAAAWRGAQALNSWEAVRRRWTASARATQTR